MFEALNSRLSDLSDNESFQDFNVGPFNEAESSLMNENGITAATEATEATAATEATEATAATEATEVNETNEATEDDQVSDTNGSNHSDSDAESNEEREDDSENVPSTSFAEPEISLGPLNDVYEDEQLKMSWKRIGFQRNHPFKLTDYHFKLIVEVKDESKTLLFQSLLNGLIKSIESIFVYLKETYASDLDRDVYLVSKSKI